MTEDLDALAVTPLDVKVGGHTYKVEVTVATMIEVNKAQTAGEDPMELAATVMAAAGMPREAFLALNPQQAGRLNELIVARFFGPTEEEAAKAETAKLSGPTLSPDSSTTAAGPTD